MTVSVSSPTPAPTAQPGRAGKEVAHPTPRGKVTIGLAALCAQWFKEVGLQGSEVSSRLGTDYDTMVQLLSQVFGKVVAPGVISTEDDTARAVDLFCREQIDALLLVHIMWSEDQPLIALLEALHHTPLLLWDYHPTGSLGPHLTISDMFRCSGTVGMLQGSAVLQRRGVSFELISGAPAQEALKRDLAEYEAALRIHKRLRGAGRGLLAHGERGVRAGRIAGRCEVMTGTFVDEEALATGLGVQLVEITAEDYAAACKRVPDADVERYRRSLVAQYPVDGVSAGSLRLACRNTLALDALALEHDLGAVAIQDLDPGLHRLVGTRPCLCPPGCAERGVPIVMESDLNTGLGLLAPMIAAEAPGMFTEIFTSDPAADLLLMGHAGVHNPAVAAPGTVRIIPDAEYRHVDAVEGAWFEFIMAAGPVTCVSLYDPQGGHGYRMVVFHGESQGGPLRLDGFAHAVVKTDVPVPELLARLVRHGLTQHFAVVPGRIAGILEKWARLARVDFILETQHDQAH